MKIEHIGIAVRDLATSIPLFEKLLNSQCYKTEEVSREQVTTAFLQTDNAKIELLENSGPDGVIASFIERRGEGIHHIAFEVDDIVGEMARLKSNGFELLHDEPRVGADNKLVCFLRPKTTNGLLMELCMDISRKADRPPQTPDK